MVNDLPPGGERAVVRCDILGAAPFSDSAQGLFRAYLSPAWATALGQLSVWMERAGMTVRQDAAGNLVGRYEGAVPEAPALMIGSHIDSVPMAGNYDGPLGIMLGIETVAALHADKRRLPFAIEVVAFGDEEGSRFPAAMLTSRVVGGETVRELDQFVDAEGISLPDALAACGLEAARFGEAARQPGELLGYLETHIEQGPVLEAEGLALGAVSGIAAQLRIEMVVTGLAGHAGTTPMGLRRDAMAGTAEMIAAIEALALADGGDLVATVGVVDVTPGAGNVVPGRVRFLIDLRSGDRERRDAAAEAIAATTTAIAERRGLALSRRVLFDLAGTASDERFTRLLCEAMERIGHPPRILVSGAGHDAMSLAPLCPTAMLFVRCAGGISHNPAESVDPADAEAALQAMLAFLDLLETQYT